MKLAVRGDPCSLSVYHSRFANIILLNDDTSTKREFSRHPRNGYFDWLVYESSPEFTNHQSAEALSEWNE